MRIKMVNCRMLSFLLPSPVEKLELPAAVARGIHVYLKRDDLIHPIVSGNKWRKLKYTLEKYRTGEYQGILSFGGLYSNHLHALSYVCHTEKIPMIAVLRGEKQEKDNPMLQDIRSWGSQCLYEQRSAYKEKEILLKKYQALYPNHFIIPEGGFGPDGVKGCMEILKEPYPIDTFDYICCSVGSGTTLAGIIFSSSHTTRVIGFAPMKGENRFPEVITELALACHIESQASFDIIQEYHFGGFGKTNPTLLKYISEFEEKYNIPLDIIYTGKMMFGIEELLRHNFFIKDSKILVLHSGGLQGNRSKMSD